MRYFICLIMCLLLSLSCKHRQVDPPIGMKVWEGVGLVKPDGSKISFIFENGENNKFRMNYDDLCNYMSVEKTEDGKQIVVEWARSKKYTGEYNSEANELFINHISPNISYDFMYFSKYNFFIVHKIIIDGSIVYQNENAVSDTVWDSWMNDLSAMVKIQHLQVWLNEEFKVEKYEHQK